MIRSEGKHWQVAYFNCFDSGYNSYVNIQHSLILIKCDHVST